MRVGVVGAGWSGLAAARALTDAGHYVTIYEKAAVIGGHSRSEMLQGVVYEPNGAHIFHTSDPTIAAFVVRFGLTRRFEHRVKTLVHLDGEIEPRLLSWPIQLGELRSLPIWNRIRGELELRPKRPRGQSFREYVVSLIGPTLYSIFIEGYTEKQWGSSAARLSSSIAPKRVELRDDGETRLFKDSFEAYPAEGMSSLFDRLAIGLRIETCAELTIDDLGSIAADVWVVTAPLDVFARSDRPLEWRGVTLRSVYHMTDSPTDTISPAYVVNYPDRRYPFTRTIESKHATRQVINGTVISYEYPGSGGRHYPVPTVDRWNERHNEALKGQIREGVNRPVWFCGRLANYQYINQDQAIRQGLDIAESIIGDRRP